MKIKFLETIIILAVLSIALASLKMVYGQSETQKAVSETMKQLNQSWESQIGALQKGGPNANNYSKYLMDLSNNTFGNTKLTGIQQGIAVVEIISDTKWSGSILDSSFDSATRDGSGNTKIPIVCYGIYSLSFQKQTDYGKLFVSVIKDGVTIDSQYTTAQYGIVSLAGNC
jgi:type II secretory pathway pseudopilin PulG